MSVTVAKVAQPTGFNPNKYGGKWTVIASADGDTTATIAHGFATTPETVILSPKDAAFYLSAWKWSADGTNITLTKTTATGSGTAGIQVEVYASAGDSLNPYNR